MRSYGIGCCSVIYDGPTKGEGQEGRNQTTDRDNGWHREETTSPIRTCAENGSKRVMESIPVAKRKRARPRTWEIREAINERNLTEERWNKRREWQFGIEQWRETFQLRT